MLHALNPLHPLVELDDLAPTLFVVVQVDFGCALLVLSPEGVKLDL